VGQHRIDRSPDRGRTARWLPEAEIVFGESCRFEAWPDVPIHVIAGSDDRFFPLDFHGGWRRSARVTVEELPGGQLLALSNPRGLADKLHRAT
jgi:surfactin synthase thioesterase subunit